MHKQEMTREVRKACRQFAMQYFHFCKVLYETLGPEKAKELAQKAVFHLAVDRSDRLRELALSRGMKADTVEDFNTVNRETDLAMCGWVPELGADHCPYGMVWREYGRDYPWFLEFATMYCDVIDTTTIENFSKCISHQITQNVILEGESCEREYFESDTVKAGIYTYGTREEK